MVSEVIGGIMGLTPISMLLIIKNLCKNVDKPKISSFYSAFSARDKRSKKKNLKILEVLIKC